MHQTCLEISNETKILYHVNSTGNCQKDLTFIPQCLKRIILWSEAVIAKFEMVFKRHYDVKYKLGRVVLVKDVNDSHDTVLPT